MAGGEAGWAVRENKLNSEASKARVTCRGPCRVNFEHFLLFLLLQKMSVMWILAPGREVALFGAILTTTIIIIIRSTSK